MSKGNTGHWNTGNYNTGHCNTGHCNTGDYNTGNYNTGNWNTGNYNTGNWNTGNCNTGDCNTGGRNTGDYNTGNWNTGFFMTTTPDTVQAFNTATVNRTDFLEALPNWMRHMPTTEWVNTETMTASEMADNPGHEVAGGFLRSRSLRDAFAAAWAGDAEKDVAAVEGLPGFDRAVWLEVTGLDLWSGDEREPFNPKFAALAALFLNNMGDEMLLAEIERRGLGDGV